MTLKQELSKIIQKAYQSGIYNADDLAAYIIKSGIFFNEFILDRIIFDDD